ncbi:PREDICTED: glutamate receptor ionotropic, delta-2-like [Branchiostoma belcheri]|uniref:Glutamate receptor ionotropic, delta-2-like n=1 Tax=Branchiostoma belcheri TaxID=7741 RepID=A0A6P4ZF32_BRABE|nr:PREDICTED: glutamate receptor ionotropic, delta-2-like [Branchiostoma belcheri]
MAQGVAAILSSTSCSSNLMLQSVCDVMHVPHIFVSRDTCDVTPDTKYTLSMNPAAFEVDRALSDIIRQQRWRTMVVLYDDEHAFSRAETLLLLTRGRVPEIVLLRLPSLSNGSDTKVTLPRLEREPGTEGRHLLKHAVVLCTVENTISVISEANKMGIFTPEHHWIVSNEEVSDHHIKALNVSKGRLTVARRQIPDTDYMDDFLQHWKSLPRNVTTSAVTSIHDVKMTALYMHDAVLHLAQAVYTLFKNRQWIGPNKLRCSLDVSLPWSGGTLLMDEFKKQSGTGGVLGSSIFEQVNYHSSVLSTLKSLQSELAGEITDNPWDIWWEDDDLSEQNFFEEMKKKSGIKGKTFRVVTVLEQPFVFRKNSSDGVTYSGFCVDLLKDLSAMLEFDFFLYEVHDGRYGSLQDDGSWNGMTRDIIQEEADLALGALAVTTEREQVLDFTRLFMEGSIGILIRKQPRHSDWLTILKPFHLKMWLCIIGGFAIVSIVLFHLQHAGTNRKGEDLNLNGTSDSTLSDTVWFLYSSSVRQGGGISLQRVSARILTGVWWLFALIVISSYTANLAAYLTVTRLQAPITSVEELLSYGSLSFGAVRHSAVVDFLSTSGVPSHQTMWSLLTASNGSLVSDTQEGIRSVKQDSYALIADLPIVQYAADRDPTCQLSVIDFAKYRSGYGIAFGNGSAFTEIFSMAILRLQDSGRLDELRHQWWPGERGKCPVLTSLPDDDTSGFSATLTLENFAVVFCVLIFGIVLACAVSLCDLLCRRACRRTSEKSKCQELNGDVQMGKFDTAPDSSPDVSVHKQENGEIHIIVSSTSSDQYPPAPPTPFPVSRTYCECCGEVRKNRDSPVKRKYCFCSSPGIRDGIWTTVGTNSRTDTDPENPKNVADFTTKL